MPVGGGRGVDSGQGYGSYFGKKNGAAAYDAEVARIVGPITGTAAALARPASEREWFVTDSYCRQEIWGSWTVGDFVQGTTTLPGPDPLFPVRTAFQQVCPQLFPPL